MISTRLTSVALAAIGSLFVPAAVYGSSAVFRPLGDLDGGIFRSGAAAVTADGTHVVGGGAFLNEPSSEAVRWDVSNYQPIPLREDLTDDGFNRGANSVSDDGTTIAGNALVRDFNSPLEPHAYRWNSSGGFEQLAPLLGTGIASVSGLSADGKIASGTSRSPDRLPIAVRWEGAGAVESLGSLPTDPGRTETSGATGISANGATIVGTSTSGNGSEGFVWTRSAGMTGIGVLPGAEAYASQAKGISADGSTVVGLSFSEAYPSSGEAILWTADGGLRGLGVLQDTHTSSSATLASSDGSLVFGSSQEFADSWAFVWGESFGMRDFRGVLETDYGLADALSGWTEITPRDISNDSLILVGSGINPDGNLEGWVLTLDRPIGVPEPSGLAVLAVIALASSSQQRSRST